MDPPCPAPALSVHTPLAPQPTLAAGAECDLHGECLLALQRQQPFGQGERRDCFVHVHDPALCVKVAREDRQPRALRAQATWWKRLRKSVDDFDENVQDWHSLSALELRDDPQIWWHISRCHGWAETDRGRGLVLELIRDEDGGISRSLQSYLAGRDPDAAVTAAVDEFAAFWLAKSIPARSFHLQNFVVRRLSGGQLRLVLIDGFADTGWIPLSLLTPALARWRARRRILDLRRKIAALLRHA